MLHNSPHLADVRRAREALAIARYYEDKEGERAALARLTGLGVDESGDDLQMAGEEEPAP